MLESPTPEGQHFKTVNAPWSIYINTFPPWTFYREIFRKFLSDKTLYIRIPLDTHIMSEIVRTIFATPAMAFFRFVYVIHVTSLRTCICSCLHVHKTWKFKMTTKIWKESISARKAEGFFSHGTIIGKSFVRNTELNLQRAISQTREQLKGHNRHY